MNIEKKVSAAKQAVYTVYGVKIDRGILGKSKAYSKAQHKRSAIMGFTLLMFREFSFMGFDWIADKMHLSSHNRKSQIIASLLNKMSADLDTNRYARRTLYNCLEGEYEELVKRLTG